MELERVDKVTTGAVGEPGQRTFFLQAREGDRAMTVLLEKQQVELLASSIEEILQSLDAETGLGPGEDELALEPPLEPIWRVGRLSIGYSEERDLMLLELEELLPDEGEGEGEGAEPEIDAPEPGRIRLWATREQMRALARHGQQVASRGRPRCQFCGDPIDPEGHTCPAMNGHRGPTGA